MWNDPQKRFLDAYRNGPVVAQAARLAGVARCTVYRWAASPEFAAAMNDAADVYFRGVKQRVLAQQAARKQELALLEQGRRQMRRDNLAKARSMRGR